MNANTVATLMDGIIDFVDNAGSLNERKAYAKIILHFANQL